MLNDETLEYAKRECAVHASLKNENIIQLFEYTENDDFIELFMEYANDPLYLEQLIEEVRHTHMLNLFRLIPQ